MAWILFTLLTSFIHQGLALNFIAIGDWGITGSSDMDAVIGEQRQAQVAKAMNQWATKKGGVDFIISTGDNFYPRGINSVNSERFNISWKRVYDFGKLKNVPWYITLGNHDYQARGPDIEKHLVNYKDPLWKCPHMWYTHTFTTGHTKFQLIVLDVTALKIGKYNPISQYRWFKRQLKNSDAHWKMVVVHNPIYAVGKYGPVDRFMVEYILPLVLLYGVDVVLSGHDHALEHIKRQDNSGPDFVVSGAGGKPPYQQDKKLTKGLRLLGLNVMYYKADNGFVGFSIHNNKMHVEFYDRTFMLLHNFTRWKGIGYRQMHSLDIS